MSWAPRAKPGRASRTLDIANIGLAAELLGPSAEAFERTVAYLKGAQAVRPGDRLFPGLATPRRRAVAELELARSIVLQALQAVDAGDASVPCWPAPPRPSCRL